MKLTGTTRMAAGLAAATITAALALPGMATAVPHHDKPKPQEPKTVTYPPKLCLFMDEAGRYHTADWPGWGHHGPPLHGALPCGEDVEVQDEEGAPAYKPTRKYPTQSQTGSVASSESSEVGIVIVTLAAAAALGGVAVRRSAR